MIKKQLKTTLICLAIFVVLTVIYLTVVAPMLVAEPTYETPIELLDGEARGSNNRVYMFPPVARAAMKKIQVNNDKGGYVFYRSSGQFYIDGKELAPYDLEIFSTIVVSTGSSLALRRFEIDETTDLSVYGLAASDNPASFTITTEDDTVHKVWVGDKIPTGGGYYCQYDGRDAIYVLGTSLTTAIESSVYDLITPTVGLVVPESSYSSVEELGVIKDGIPLIEIISLTPEENGTSGTDSPTMSYEFNLINIDQYTPDVSVFTYIIQTCSSMTGTEVIAAGKELTTEVLKDKYGLDPDSPFFVVYYTYDGTDCTIFFSEPDEDGNMYVYSGIYDMVVKMNVTNVPFYNFKLSMYVEKNLYPVAIGDVTKISIAGKIKDGVENIEVDSTFGLKNENDVQYLWIYDTNEHFDADEINNFRKIYRDILQLSIGGEADSTEINPDKKLLTVIMTNKDGEETRFDFYAYSATRCYYTINGEKGAFYVERSNVEAVVRDTHSFNNGYTVDPEI